MRLKSTNILVAISLFALLITAKPIQASDGFEFRNGLDNGGFEIGNGREIFEIFNRIGEHGITLYTDFDYEPRGENTWATGFLARGLAKTTLNLGIVNKNNPNLSQFLVNGLKNGEWSMVELSGLSGLKKDIYNATKQLYRTDIQLYVSKKKLVVFNLTSSTKNVAKEELKELQLKEIQAIASSIRLSVD